MDDYEAYSFTAQQSISLNVFFDLAQEFSTLEQLYAVCLLIPKMFFNIDCTLYVLDSKTGAIRRCAYRCLDADAGEFGDLPFPQKTLVREDRLFIPIKGNHADRVGPEQAQHPRFGRGFEARPQHSGVDSAFEPYAERQRGRIGDVPETPAVRPAHVIVQS